MDGETTWEGRDGVPAIADGALVTDITVPVTLVPAAAPSPSASAERRAQRVRGRPAERRRPPTPKPTADPHARARRPTADADRRRRRRPRPRRRRATPTPTPTPAPTASPSAAPTASPSATPTPAPDTGIIRGTLTYNESHELTPDAKSVVLLVEGSTGPTSGTTVASVEIKGGSEPVPFELAYPFAASRPTRPTGCTRASSTATSRG